jgi:hypothetical protein
MAINKISKGRGFAGVFNYVLRPSKRPYIIGKCAIHNDPHNLAIEFHQVANLRPTVQKPMRHISIAFAPEDGEVDNLVKEAIALRVLDGLGYRESQYLIVGHHRDDPGHDRVHNHDHFHIVTNAVTLTGEYVHDSFDRYKIQPILRSAERDFGLRQIQSSWEVKQPKVESVNHEIAKVIRDIATRSQNLRWWLQQLAKAKIKVRFNLSKNNNVKGVTFLHERSMYRGSDLGIRWQSIADRLSITATDLELMQANNLSVRAESVELDPIDRALFDRAVEMSLLKLGRSRSFKNSRVEIKRDGDNLSIVRMRPHKLMIKAELIDEKWQPVGFIDIDRRDVELLERMNRGVAAESETNIVHGSFAQEPSPWEVEPDDGESESDSDGMELE